MPTDPLDPEFALEGATPKPGQAVPPTNLPQQFARGREALIQEGAELTGVPPAEVVRRGIVRAEMPLYGAAGVIGVGAAAQQPGVSEDAGAALGQGAQ